jgi:large subunit ribosomal protein L11
MSEKEIKVIVEGGKATAGPPIGPALGPLGVPAGKVVAEINKATASFAGLKVPVTIKVNTKTKEFTIEVGTPPTSELLKKEAGIEKGHGAAWKEGAAGNVPFEKVLEIAKSTLGKSNASSLKARVKEVIGTAQSIGVTVDGKIPKEVIREIDEGKYDSYF